METQCELQVRTIDGQCVAVRVKADWKVHNLKVHLQQDLKWPPDSEPNVQFHIFLKGQKLDASTQLDTLSLLDSDFLVLVPYTRKSKSKRRKLDEGPESAHHDALSDRPMREDKNSGPTERAELANSCISIPQREVMKPTEAMWHTIAADLAAVNSRGVISQDAHLSNEGWVFGEVEAFQKSELKDQEGVRERGLGTTEVMEKRVAGETSFQNPVNLVDGGQSKQPKQNRPGTSEVLYEGLRMQSREGAAGPIERQETGNLGHVLPQSNGPALPPVLEKLKRVFFSLNAVCGFLQKQHMQPTWQNVKQALQQLCCPEGEEVTVQDIHLLALLCPKLVVLSNMTGEGEDSAFYIDLFDPSTLKKWEELGKANGNLAIATNIEQIGPSDFMPNSGVVLYIWATD